MRRPEAPSIRLHEDPELFLAALTFTVANTALAARLIEKDYFSSVLLDHIFKKAGPLLVFKGGTCLSKVHAEFYRLSEDLDFMIPMPIESKRNERRLKMEPLKRIMETLSKELPVFLTIEPLSGANESTQYIGVLGYRSFLHQQVETIKIEIGLREPLLQEATIHKVQTILRDPVLNGPMVEPIIFACISRMEAYSEKFRAALTRREVAIRDFFDIDYAVRKLDLKTDDKDLARLIRSKLAVPGNEPVDISETRLSALRQQMDSQLKPVLRDRDYQAFDLERALRLVREVASRLTSQQ
jgi:predicted nucleotidyltransferase component of viral defense system